MLVIQRRPPEVYLLQSFCQFVNILIFGTLVAMVNVQSSGSGDTSGGCPTNLNYKIYGSITRHDIHCHSFTPYYCLSAQLRNRQQKTLPGDGNEILQEKLDNLSRKRKSLPFPAFAIVYSKICII